MIDQFTHYTQDDDHGVPTSLRISVSEANAPVESSGSFSQWIDDVPVPGPYTQWWRQVGVILKKGNLIL
jgi:hypothetical protein